MAAVIANSTLAEVAAATTLPCSVPAGATAGDLLVAVMSTSLTAAIPDQSGWTTIGKGLVGSAPEAMYYRWATASEPASYTFTSSGSGQISVSMHRVTGVDATTPLDVAAVVHTHAAATGSTVTAPGITTVTTGALVIHAASLQSATEDWTSIPSGTTQVTRTTGIARRQVVSHQTVTGATGTRVWTQTAPRAATAIHAAFRPAAGPASAPIVDAGADALIVVNTAFARTATVTEDGSAVTSVAWTIQSGPSGAGSTIGTTAALNVTPTAIGSYVLRCTATSAAGDGYDEITVTVQAATPLPVTLQEQVPSGDFADGSLSRTALTTGTLAGPIAAGDLLVVAVAVDKSAGTFTIPSGWTAAANVPAVSVSTLIVWRTAVGDGSDPTAVTVNWSTATDGAAAMITRWRGTTGAAIGVVANPAYSNTARTSLALNPAANGPVSAAAAAILVTDSIESTTDTTNFRPAAAGWTWQNTASALTALGAPAVALVTRNTAVAPSEDLASTTFTWTGPAEQAHGVMLLIEDVGGTPPPPTGSLTSLWTGIPNGTSVPVVAHTASATSVRLKVGTDANVTTGVTYTSPVTPSASGYASFAITGLTPGTGYWYQAEVDGVLAAEIGAFTTDTPATARSFRVAFGSCLNTSSTPQNAFDYIVGNDPELFLHLGDYHYRDSTSTSAGAHTSNIAAQLAANGGLRELTRLVPTGYIWSDHDSGGNDWTGGPAAWTPAYNTAYREAVPVLEALPTGGIYRSVHRGRVKFILTDGRSFKSPKANADDANKSMFGAAQEQWIAAELADPNYAVKIIAMDVPWVYPTTAGDDKWGGYTAAAQRLVDAIAAADARVFVIHGDAHSLCADDGTSANNRGGLPVAGAASFGGRTSSIKGGSYSQGTWPTAANIGTIERQHGLLDILDSGSTISIAFSGRDSGNTERVSLLREFQISEEPPPASGRVVEMWDGTQLAQVTSEVWTGTTLAPQVLDD